MMVLFRILQFFTKEFVVFIMVLMNKKLNNRERLLEIYVKRKSP